MIKPHVFIGASEGKDPILFLDTIKKALYSLECSDMRSVDLFAYYLQDIAKERLKSFKVGD